MIFLILSVIVFLFVTVIAPKRLSKCEIYIITLFSIVIGFTTDITLDLKYNLYGYFTPGVQFLGFLPILLLFPTSGVLFMNFFPYQKSLIRKLLYIIGWSIFSLFYEFLSIKSGYFYHNGWKYWHSALTYPVLFWLHLTHFKIIRRYIN